ncbi:MAG: SMC family ATPase [Chitinophagales bacterium]
MIPVSLTLQGIYSYQQKQTVNFEPLTNAGIFGIFGSVGSGKSTILEAISFALYGETERLHKRDDRAYNMMNLKSKEMNIDFIFKTGANAQEYRFVVKGKRNNRNFDKVTTLDRTAYKKVNAGWEPINVNSTEDILQLSYENFRRTIIIPQGKFQEFLELTDTERTRMMKELFHLQKFELSDNVSVIEQRTNEQRIRLEERIQHTGVTTPEELSAKENELTLIREHLKSNQLMITEKKRTEQLFAQLKNQFLRIAEQREAFRLLQQQEPEMNTLEQRINRYEFCHLHFKPLFDRRKELQQDTAKQTILLDQQKQLQQEKEQELGIKEKQYPEVKKAFENRPQLKERSDELEKIILLNKMEQDMKIIIARLEKGMIFIQTVEEEIAALQQQQVDLTKHLKKQKAQLPDLVELSAISNWFVQKNALSSIIENTINEQKTLKEKSKQFLESRQAVFSPALKKIVPEAKADEPGMLIDQLKSALLSSERLLQNKEDELQHVLLQQELEEYATQLKPGEPCPLCGAIDHPQILSASDVKAAVKKVKTAKEVLQKNNTLLSKTIRELEMIESTETALSNQLKELQQRQVKEEAVLQEYDVKFIWRSYSSDDDRVITKLFAQARIDQKVIRETETQLEAIEKQLKEKAVLKETGKNTIDDLNIKLSAHHAQIDLLKGQLKVLRIDEYVSADMAVLKEEIRQLTEGYAAAEVNYRTLDQQVQQLRKATGELSGVISAGQNALRQAMKIMTDTEDRILLLSKESGFKETDIVELLTTNLNIERSKNSLKLFQQQFHTARQMLEESERDTAGKIYDQAEHQELSEEIAKATILMEQQVQQNADISAALNQAKQNLEQRALLTKQLNEVLLRSADIATLKNLFKASGFVNYVSAVHLQQLCNAANERFYKLTRQKLRLEVSDSNNFLVRDFMNNGQLRSVKTLSGGQKFQAALSLALALADSIQIHSQSKQNFFFLDEGFGSLDNESLAMVFETLRSLRKENRIVGIISHVHEMQQEIDTCLTIVNEEEEGSRVEASW